MKKLNQILFATALAATIILSNVANAQYKVTEDDGIAASPKVRQILREQKASATASKDAVAAVASVGQQTTKAALAASPKLRQALSERQTALSTSAAQVASAEYKPTGIDGITASPKLRQQLKEQTRTILVAPVK